jgi:hypothetical protein
LSIRQHFAYAVKSAEPVAAKVASEESLDCQTAPLCPRNVPILNFDNQNGYYVACSGLAFRLDLPISSGAISKHGVIIYRYQNQGRQFPVKETVPLHADIK